MDGWLTYPNRAVVKLDNRFAQRKAQPRALSHLQRLGTNLHEVVEEFGLVGRGDSRPRVGDRDRDVHRRRVVFARQTRHARRKERIARRHFSLGAASVVVICVRNIDIWLRSSLTHDSGDIDDDLLVFWTELDRIAEEVADDVLHTKAVADHETRQAIAVLEHHHQVLIHNRAMQRRYHLSQL